MSDRLPHDWHPDPPPANVVIGDGSWLHSSFAFVHCRSTRAVSVRIGRHCGVYKGSFFDLGPDGEVWIGDYSTLVAVIIAGNARVRIGSYCFLAHDVVIADAPAAAPSRGGADRGAAETDTSIELGDDVWIGAGAVLLTGTRVGDGAIVGAAAVVDFPVPAGAVVAGNPARIVSR